LKCDFADINECATNNGGCGSDVTCYNTIGSYKCGCPKGYMSKGGICIGKSA